MKSVLFLKKGGKAYVESIEAGKKNKILLSERHGLLE